ncbi:MAG TPA: tRNA lysidine(34) synthetase TilS [Bacteroidia bacterium]|nr:tRNA lysidine(34) synthetase TilS [Bacteroidia bacterium]
MFQEFLTNIKNNSLFSKKDFLLLAVSGGVDSVVLAHLLHLNQFKFAIAHCNFSLRGNDSDEDEKFVQKLAHQYKVPCFTIKFNTQQYALEKKLSIQIAARELRYQWFSELLSQFNFNYLLTAHHLDDSIETTFLNLIRGTGIKGITGIPQKTNKIVRPLLQFTKNEILQYARTNNLEFREDISNLKDDYQRNYLRLKIIPQFKELQPNIYSVFQNNFQHFNEAQKFIDENLSSILNTLIIKEKESIQISKNKLLQIPNLHFVLFQYLSKFDFNDDQIHSILNHLNAHSQSGKEFYSKTHRLIIDRENIFITKLNSQKIYSEYIAHTLDELNLFTTKFHFELIPSSKEIDLKDKTANYINADKLTFPLIIRHKKDGDVFQLLGTNYQRKLSDIFIDKKMPLFKKEKCLLLCNSNEDIVWISELKLINEKYKISHTTKSVLKISYCE